MHCRAVKAEFTETCRLVLRHLVMSNWHGYYFAKIYVPGCVWVLQSLQWWSSVGCNSQEFLRWHSSVGQFQKRFSSGVPVYTAIIRRVSHWYSSVHWVDQWHSSAHRTSQCTLAHHEGSVSMLKATNLYGNKLSDYITTYACMNYLRCTEIILTCHILVLHQWDIHVHITTDLTCI